MTSLNTRPIALDVTVFPSKEADVTSVRDSVGDLVLFPNAKLRPPQSPLIGIFYEILRLRSRNFVARMRSSRINYSTYADLVDYFLSKHQKAIERYILEQTSGVFDCNLDSDSEFDMNSHADLLLDALLPLVDSVSVH